MVALSRAPSRATRPSGRRAASAATIQIPTTTTADEIPYHREPKARPMPVPARRRSTRRPVRACRTRKVSPAANVAYMKTSGLMLSSAGWVTLGTAVTAAPSSAAVAAGARSSRASA